MKTIKSAQLRDFTDARVKKLDGDLREVASNAASAIQQLETWQQQGNTNINFEEVVQQLSYHLQYVFAQDVLEGIRTGTI